MAANDAAGCGMVWTGLQEVRALLCFVEGVYGRGMVGVCLRFELHRLLQRLGGWCGMS